MNSQRGTTLVIVLVMLVVLTLLALAGMRMSNSSLSIVGNMQARRLVENIAQQTIEDVMNSIVPFNSPAGPVTLRNGATTLPANAGTAVTLTTPPWPNGIKVTVSSRTCLASAPASGYSAVQPIVPEDNLWEYTVTVTDTFTQATTTMGQGTKIRQLSGSCT